MHYCRIKPNSGEWILYGLGDDEGKGCGSGSEVLHVVECWSPQ